MARFTSGQMTKLYAINGETGAKHLKPMEPSVGTVYRVINKLYAIDWNKYGNLPLLMVDGGPLPSVLMHGLMSGGLRHQTGVKLWEFDHVFYQPSVLITGSRDKKLYTINQTDK